MGGQRWYQQLPGANLVKASGDARHGPAWILRPPLNRSSTHDLCSGLVLGWAGGVVLTLISQLRKTKARRGERPSQGPTCRKRQTWEWSPGSLT